MHNSTNTTGEAMHPNVIPFTPEGDFYFSKGVQAFQRREFEKAIKWINRSIELSPKQPLYQCQLSVVHTEIGNYHSANQVLMDVLAEFGHEYVDCFYLIANNYAHLGLFHDAMKYAKEYMQKAPNGDFKEEAEQLLTLVDIDEEDDDDEDWAMEEEDELMRYQESAFYHLERQEWEEALPILDDMIRFFPSYFPAKHDYAMALFFYGNQIDAIELEEKWKQQHPSSIHTLCNLSVFYHLAGKPEAANEHIQQLRNVYPIHEQQQLKVAVTLAQVGFYKDAYERFIVLPKSKLRGHLSYYKWFSISAYQRGEPSRALSLWEEGCLRHSSLSQQGGPWDQ
ncbi:hypothetical protein GLW08_12115 [Pontibacillus yanchengensis]|uniref:Uncharacterized protein n=2 Tax=Pontibacillus yanchengensis TaxID=462910 RepID=A0ACC7VGI7_9BACI|nr:hypothetical protein [Pontibacillus yanchengensis]MYL34033.1 hypothetical protein [Pontibacillus yanchengensis]MYL54083.1 hypothetical protein [Pontibacillus yanchengensis]